MIDLPMLAVTFATGESLVTALTAIYWICAILGGGLLVISTLSGAHGHADAEMDTDLHADFDGALHADVDVDVDAPATADVGVDDIGHAGDAHTEFDGLALSNWFSLRFVVFFMAVFGVTGVMMTYLTTWNVGLSFGIAMVVGVGVGQIVHQLVLRLKRMSGDSTPQPHDYVNKLARVTIDITPPENGEIVMQVRRSKRYVPAVARGGNAAFERGSEVVVVGYRGGVAEVVSREEYTGKGG